jgi:hypothetical protein
VSRRQFVLAKLAAGREHDLEFARAAIDSKLVDTEQLVLGVDLLPPTVRDAVRERLAALLSA